MAASSPLSRLQSACVTCVRGGQRFIGRYRDFLLAPATLFTLVSLLLLILATILSPDGIINSTYAHTWLYLAAALAGSVYIWWSAIQGIRERDFTADIPVSFATAAALLIGQYSAAAVVPSSCCWAGCWKSSSPHVQAMPSTSWQRCFLFG